MFNTLFKNNVELIQTFLLKVKIIRTAQPPVPEEEDDSEDDLPPPPPPPGSPPPHLWPPRVKPVNNIHPQLPTSLYPPSPFPQTVLYPPAPPFAPQPAPRHHMPGKYNSIYSIIKHTCFLSL